VCTRHGAFPEQAVAVQRVLRHVDILSSSNIFQVNTNSASGEVSKKAKSASWIFLLSQLYSHGRLSVVQNKSSGDTV